MALAVVPALGAVLSVLLGQDANWDLGNYHLYNAWAFWHQRWNHDLAPAGFQSYFNPLLDLPHYALTQALPPVGVAAVMGAWHALALLALWLVVRELVGPALAQSRLGWAMVGVAGMLPVFLSELGSTMGDSGTAVLVLLALFLVLRGDAQTSGVRNVMWAGVLVGTAVGLKLTNAPYALGLCTAVLVGPGTWAQRWRRAGLLGAAGTVSLVFAAGPWMLLMYQQFGNPLFPQFNAWFGAPLAAPIHLADARWGPQQWWEWLLWPAIMTLQWRRFAETELVNLMWPLVYGLAMVWGWRRCAGRLGLLRHPSISTAPGHSVCTVAGSVTAVRSLCAFVLVAFVAWLLVFAIGRYTLVLELLLPLLLWLGLGHLWPGANTRRWWLGLSVVVVAVGVSQRPGWGRVPFGEHSYAVALPAEVKTAQPSTVLVLGQPLAWMIPQLPPAWRYVSVAGAFPESVVYRQQVRQWLSNAAAPHYAILGAEPDGRLQTLERVNGWLQTLGVDAQSGTCDAVLRLAQRGTKWRELQRRTSGTGLCGFELPATALADGSQTLQALLDHWQTRLQPYGVRLQASSCQMTEAAIGRSRRPYYFCSLA